MARATGDTGTTAFQAVGHPATGMRVCVIGTGYVGLTAGACFAHLGHTVACTDRSDQRVHELRHGTLHLVEQGLPELVSQVVAQGRLRFDTDNVAASADADVVFLCLPTPPAEDGSADLSRVLDVAREIGPHLRPGCVVVDKSTVPVGTSALVREALGRDDVLVAANPEFLAEGSAVRDFLEPDRVVIGSDDPGAAERVARLYRPLDTHLVLTDAASAETIKYAANAYLAVRLSFVNSMAEVCEAAGADITAVMDGVGSDHRIGRSFLSPGPGWGGSCFPKDTSALLHTSMTRGFDFRLLRAATDYNEEHQRWMVSKVLRELGPSPEGAVVAMWGLTFKAGTDDLRDSPAIEIARMLTDAGCVVRAFDPTVRRPLPGLTVCTSPVDACRGAQTLVVATEWPVFRRTDLAAAGQVMAQRSIIDMRNLLDPEDAVASGFRYDGVGRGRVTASRYLAAPALV
jgi:UDPglucose 6-dehydrogenase